MFNTKNSIPVALCVVLAPFVAAGCGGKASNGGGGAVTTGGGGTTARPAEVVSDAVGQQPIPGVVQISGIDTSNLNTNGTVVYTVDNVSGGLQEDLSWSVLFMYPPKTQGTMTLPYDSDVTSRQELLLTEGKRGHQLKAVSAEFGERSQRGQTVLATQLLMTAVEKTALVARELDGRPGTRVLNRSLECVGLSSEDDLYNDPPTMWIDFENISGQAVGASEIKVVFMRGLKKRVVAETGWFPFQEVGAGQRARFVPDLRGVGKVRNLEYLVKVRLASPW